MKDNRKTIFREKYFQFADLLEYGIIKIDDTGSVQEINNIALDMIWVDKEAIPTKLPNYLQEAWLEYDDSDVFFCRKSVIVPDGEAYKFFEIFFNKIDKNTHIMLMRSFPIKEESQAKQIQNLLKELNHQVQKAQGTRTYLLEEIEEYQSFKELIGKNENYRTMLSRLAEVAYTNASVLIEGETGTGKELLARAIHNLSQRRKNPFIKINCASVRESYFDSEIFGHEEGAFPGALFQKIGKFELADESTLFLNKVGELSLDMQSKLLTFLEEGKFERLGNAQVFETDVRIIASSSKSLQEMVKAGTFRKDLYYCLNVFPLQNPPLRQRRDDIPLLIHHFVKKCSQQSGKEIKKIPKKQVDVLSLYDFPGNVRELENLVERAIILTKGDTLNLEAVLMDIRHQDITQITDDFKTFEQMQTEHIVAALEKTRWKVSGKNSASQVLNLNPKTLVSKMKKLGIRREDFK